MKKNLEVNESFPCIKCGEKTLGRFGITVHKRGPAPKNKRKNEKSIPVCFNCYKKGIAESIFKRLKLLD